MIRTLYPAGFYQQSVCVESGAWADTPDTENPWMDFQMCYNGIITVSDMAANLTFTPWGIYAASVVDLGTMEDIQMQYNVGA